MFCDFSLLSHPPGSINNVSRYYQSLPTCVKDRVAGLGFDGIIAALHVGPSKSSQAAMTALVERWMDSTHTFHLPFGEMTIAPLDFAAITGLSFSGLPVPFGAAAYYPSASSTDEWAIELFGRKMEKKDGCSSLVRYSKFVDDVHEDFTKGEATSEQLARCFLFYLLSVVVFPNLSHTGALWLLPVLQDLDRLHEYSWGVAALSYLYQGLDAASRGASRLCGCQMVVDVSHVFLLVASAFFLLYSSANF